MPHTLLGGRSWECRLEIGDVWKEGRSSVYGWLSELIGKLHMEKVTYVRMDVHGNNLQPLIYFANTFGIFIF